MPTLQIRSVPPYSAVPFQRWKDGHYDVLADIRISQFIRDILKEKATRRRESRLRKGYKSGDRRFFGEAYIASQIPHEQGWYGSFKWLTSSASATGASNAHSREFGAALGKYFGHRSAELHQTARRLCDLPDCRKPVPPDLWLISGGKHRFIESKLRGDIVRPSQLAGLAVIAVCLSEVVPVSVEVIRIFSQAEKRHHDKEEAERREMEGTFEHYCHQLRAG